MTQVIETKEYNLKMNFFNWY